MRLTPKATNLRCMLFITGLILSYHPQPVQTNAILVTVFSLGIQTALRILEDVTISNQLNQINSKIDGIEHQIVSKVELSVAKLLKQHPSFTDLKSNLHDLAALMGRIKSRNREMRSYKNSEQQINRHTLETFASTTVEQDGNSVQELLSQIEQLVLGSQDIPFRRLGTFELMLQATEETDLVCSFGMSAQQVLYELFNAISITEIKGYSMMKFSWMLLAAYGKGNFTAEAKLMRRRFEERTNQTQLLLQQVMKQASRVYWRCDPKHTQHKEGKTFVQLTRLLQGFVENEVSLNTVNTCMEDCAYYSWGVQQERCYEDEYCTKQPKCSGKIYDCEFIDSHMWICPAAANTNRRYEYIEYENGIVLGNSKQCAHGTTKVESWWRWIFWHCSYCFCLCDDAGQNSDRYINMRESVSDVMNDKVVTGMRFVKKNRIIHLIVQQGRLLPRGQIDNTTLEWVEPHNYTVMSQNVHNGQDYHTLSRNNRSLDLDDLYVPQGYVVTGVRIRLVDNHLNLEIRETQMNFATGQLVDPDKSIWIGSNDKKIELTLDQPNVPLLSPLKSEPSFVSNRFIRFRESDRRTDAAQTTVPFFDAQPVVPVNPVPLSGAGLFHKGQPRFGGFVAPKVMTYDFGPHVLAPIVRAEDEAPRLKFRPNKDRHVMDYRTVLWGHY